MRAEDQAVRQRWIERNYDAEVGREMTALAGKHTARLRAIYKRYGFPGVRLVGRDGADAAHTLTLHSPSVAFQKESLVYLELAEYVRELEEMYKMPAANAPSQTRRP